MREKITARRGAGSLLLCGYAFLLLGCAATKPVPPPELALFQSKEATYPALVPTSVPQFSRIQVGDILGIIVSSLNKESNEIMNFYNVSTLPVSSFSPAGQLGGSGSQPLGYPVDSLGYVSLPLIGRQKLEGLTIRQAEDRIRAEVTKTLKDPAVNIRFMNHKFTVLGEVNNVGIFNLLNDQTSIIEAVTAAGDLTIFGKRDSVMVIRRAGGRREIGLINLRTRDVFGSPYFYVRNEDVIYVPPTQAKTLPPPPEPQPSQFVQRLPLFMSIFTAVISLLYLFKR